MTKLLPITILVVEFAIAVASYVVFDLATHHLQTCETADFGCGTSKVITVSSNLLELMALIITATLVVLGVHVIAKRFRKKRQ